MPNDSTNVRHSSSPATLTQSPPRAPLPPPRMPHGSAFIRFSNALTVTSATTVKDALPAESAAPLAGAPRIGQQPVLLDQERRVAGFEDFDRRVAAIAVDGHDHVVAIEPVRPPQPTPSKWKWA